jgi:hypothetical protein
MIFLSGFTRIFDVDVHPNSRKTNLMLEGLPVRNFRLKAVRDAVDISAEE